MQPIDAAHERFVNLREAVSGYINSVETEADTRLKIIDRILVEVLMWPHGEILTEAAVDSGYADYAFLIDKRCRMILEAKSDGRSMGCENRKASRSGFKLSGPVFKNSTAREGISQAIRYCGEKNAELACVTNGREWIVFRGNRLGDGIDTRSGMAFIFPNLVAIEENFEFFYDLLSYESSSTLSYRPYFQEAEGQPIRTSLFNKSLRPEGSARFQSGGELAADIDKVMSTFFRRLTGDQDPDLLEICFVETRESYYAERQLARVAENIVGRLRSIDTHEGTVLSDIIKSARDTQRHEFVLIVGTKGAGKTTFVSRFFARVLPQSIQQHCTILRVDLRESTGDLSTAESWLDTKIIRETERVLFRGSPEYAEIQGMFFDEYVRLSKGPWSSIYASDREGFKLRFGDHVEAIRSNKPHEYVQGLVRHIVNNRKKLPVIVFDNADHFTIEFQQFIYRYARSIYEQSICLIILPITDRTSWQLSKHGTFQSFEHETLFLPTPPTEEVIRKRIKFMEERLELERDRPSDRYFVGNGISLSIDDLTAFTRSLQRIFLETSSVSSWIGDLANHDVRRTLKIARDFITSPHLKVHDLLRAYIARNGIELPPVRAARALIRGKYDIYPVNHDNFVQNIFNLNNDLPTSPLLGMRILQLLDDAPRKEHEGALLDLDQILAYCVGLDIENRATTLWLDTLLKTRLVLNYDPTVDDISHAKQLEISPAGKQHLFWGYGNYEYLSAMADVTPLLSEMTFTKLREEANSTNKWRTKVAIFIDYLVAEDALYCTVPDHVAYQSQARVVASLSSVARRLRESVDNWQRNGDRRHPRRAS
ncbi:AAA family ATPase [Fodinicola acaciae]|uniref:AAA family ATPase n=1 Tax=Fodinicola acaciae TaxID=2681555 RepID=UPI0013D258A3|nr:AAA family ATPase [Fodinicola acaciae]